MKPSSTRLAVLFRRLFPARDFPEGMGRETHYAPVERGFRREMKKRLDFWAKLRKERQGS